MAKLSEREALEYLRGEWVCAICDGGHANQCACSCDHGPVKPASLSIPLDLSVLDGLYPPASDVSDGGTSQRGLGL